MCQSDTHAYALSRRSFLKTSTAAGFAGLAGGLSILNAGDAYAAGTSGYKALICLDLQGGLDGMDVLLPRDQPSFDQLAALRQGLFSAHNVGSGTSARDRENLIALDIANGSEFGSRQFGFAPEMAPLAQMFNDGDMAVIGNIGTLVEPTTRESMQNGLSTLPKRLFSHNSQQSIWLTRDLEGRKPGWGGEFLDALSGANRDFVGMATAGSPFLDKADIRRFDLPLGSFPRSRFEHSPYILRSGAQSDPLKRIMSEHMAAQGSRADNLFQRDLDAVHAKGEATTQAFIEAYGNLAPTSVAFPNHWVGEQFEAIANAISMRDALNVGNRQIFYTQRFGFDSHGAQIGYVERLEEIADAISAFREAMIAAGMWDSVCIFTTSDFGRTLSAGGSGTDHGWGSHAFVMGGSVAGGRIIGDVIPADKTHPQYTRSRPRLIPTTSVDQYAATLGRWFGMDDGALRTIFPNLGNFDTPDLGIF